jgi:phospholipid/cholesterol/gamma-HCH transport system substrate-binding protein
MNKYLKFFLGFIFLVVLVDLMLIDRKKDQQDMMILSATFNKVDGLNVGANVMISGINVGFVKKINLENSYPKITMMVNKNLKISNDSSISIQTDGLFGSKFLVIEIGGEENFLNNGDTFSYTEDSILLQDLLDNIIKLGESKKL